LSVSTKAACGHEQTSLWQSKPSRKRTSRCVDPMFAGKTTHAVVAIARRRVIGSGNLIPWRVPGEQRRFRELTTNSLVIMGRKTYHSIGRALPNRTTLVLTRDRAFRPADALTADSLEEAETIAKAVPGDDLYIAGGAEIYAAFMPLVDLAHVTEVGLDVEGDAFFPTLPPRFRLVGSERVTSPVCDYVYCTYDGRG
jgi:dihydrofolate reductase